MTLQSFLAELAALGVELHREGESLRASAPPGVLTADLQARIRARKPELLVHLAANGQGTAAPLPLVPRDRLLDPPPTSFDQQRLWYLDRLEPGTAVYNVPTAQRLRGPLDVDALRVGLDTVVARHEALRTRFDVADGNPVQIISDRLATELLVLDLTAPATEDREAALQALLAREAATPFDLAAGPLFRGRLVRVADDDHVLLLNVHHIVFDGWSYDLLWAELAEAYDATVKGREPDLPDLPVQYADYAVWQREWIETPAVRRQLEYWRQTLGDDVPVLELPTDRPRGATQTFGGGVVRRRIDAPLKSALSAVGRQEQATLFMVLAAALATLLQRHARQERIMVGTPIANRDREATERLIGLFLNTLVLGIDVKSHETFRTVLSRVRDVCLGAFEHRDVPFERLVEAVQPKRDLSRTPLFQVLFSFVETPVRSPDFHDLVCERIDVSASAARTDLTFMVWSTEEGLDVGLEYNADLFDRASAEGLLGRFEVLLRSVAEQPDAAVGRIPLLPPAERQRVLVEWNRTEAPIPEGAVHDLVAARCRVQGDAVAVLGEDATLTYGDLERRANRVARHLATLGIGRKAIVGICAERGAEMVVALLGILKTGAAYLPLDPDFPGERLRLMIDDAKPAAVLTVGDVTDLLGDLGCPLVRLDGDREVIARQDATAPEIAVASDDPAYVIYTSGSTGRPKGVVVPHGSVVNFLASMQREPGLTSADRLLAVTTLSFDISVLELFLPLVAGGSVVIADRETAMDGVRLEAKLAESGATVMQATPATWQLLLDVGWGGGKGTQGTLRWGGAAAGSRQAVARARRQLVEHVRPDGDDRLVHMPSGGGRRRSDPHRPSDCKYADLRAGRASGAGAARGVGRAVCRWSGGDGRIPGASGVDGGAVRARPVRTS